MTRNRNFKIDGIKVVYSIDDVKQYMDSDEEIVVIGGGEIYKLLLPYIEKMYITEIYKKYNGDVFFPQINMNKWNVIESKILNNNDIKIVFKTYELNELQLG